MKYKMMNEEKMKEAGMLYEQGLKRFAGKTALYEKYLRNFLADAHFEEARKAYEQKDFSQALEQAHALKGIAGTLALMNLYQASSDFVEAIRRGETDGLAPYFNKMEKEHRIAYEAVSTIDE